MTTKASPYLSIIIPAFNEAARILPTLEKIDHFARAQLFSTDVLVIDDCSRDATSDLVSKFIEGKPSFQLLRNERNLGKGASVQKGMLAASGQFRLFSDADLSTPIEEVTKFLEDVRPTASGDSPFDVVIGSRRVKGAELRVRQPLLREGVGRIFSLLVRLLTLRGFIDTQCGFKLFTAQAAHDIFSRQTIQRFGFDVEILYIAAKKLNLRVKEAPITWLDSPRSTVRLWRDPLDMFCDLLRIRWNDARGCYE